MGMHADDIESFGSLDGMGWRDAARRLWAAMSKEGRIGAKEAREALEGEGGAPGAFGEAMRRGLLAETGDGLQGEELLSRYASAASWHRFGEEEAAGIIRKIRRRAEESGGQIAEGVAARSIWVYGSFAAAGTSSFGDLDMFAELEWVGSGERPKGMGEALEAIREVGRRLSGDERAEIGPGCYAPAGAARELERARGGEEGEARPFRAIRIWQADGEREPGKGCEETPAGMFEPFSAEQRAALEALEAKSLAELEAEAPDGARTRLLRQPREAKKIDLGSWRAKREGEGEPTLRKEFGNGGFS